MPRVIEAQAEGAPLDFEAFVAAMRDARIDGEDEESLAAAAPLLRRLAANRRFLGDIVIAELKARLDRQLVENQYGAQVVMLHRAHDPWFVRANMWPAAHDPLVRENGIAPFFYDLPHDHNFSFLTVGYAGPGYWSDYYEYDYAAVRGHVGEKVDLRFVERSRLAEGRLLLYRAHRDVHRQWPADRFSVSLNIMESSGRNPWLDQYRFDIEKGEIAGILNATAYEAVIALAAHIGGEGGGGLLADIAAHHPTDRIRYGAICAAASAAPDLEARAAIYAQGAGQGRGTVAQRCVARLRALDVAREWAAREVRSGSIGA